MSPSASCPQSPVEEIGRLVATGNPAGLRQHVESCARCREVFERLQHNERFAQDLIEAWGGQREEDLRRRAIELSCRVLLRDAPIIAADPDARNQV